MSLKYKFKNPDGIYFTTFAAVGWMYDFTRDTYKEIFFNSLNRSITNDGLIVHARALMTSHVHLIVKRRGAYAYEAKYIAKNTT